MKIKSCIIIALILMTVQGAWYNFWDNFSDWWKKHSEELDKKKADFESD